MAEELQINSSYKHRIDEEKIALKAFTMAPCETSKDRAEQAEFFRLMRRASLRRARDRYGEQKNGPEKDGADPGGNRVEHGDKESVGSGAL